MNSRIDIRTEEKEKDRQVFDDVAGLFLTNLERFTDLSKTMAGRERSRSGKLTEEEQLFCVLVL